MSIRIQITCYHQLVAECVVESHMADRLWAKWAAMRYRRNKPIGGAVMQLASLPRYFDVPVGNFVIH